MVRKFSITEWLILINLMVYIVIAIGGLSAFILNNNILVYIGQYNKFIFERGYFWELFTALFVHFNLAHLLGNMLFLLLFGYRAEDFYDWKEYLIIFISSGMIGNLLGLLFGADFLSAGASGAIFGLFGSLLYPLKRQSSKSMRAMIFIGVIFLIFAGLNYNVDHFSHWAGFIVGIVLGRFITRKKKILQKKIIKRDRFNLKERGKFGEY